MLNEVRPSPDVRRRTDFAFACLQDAMIEMPEADTDLLLKAAL